MNKNNFDNYKYIKAKFNYTVKGYNLMYLVPGYLGFIFDNIKPSIRDVFKNFYTCTESIDFTKVTDIKKSTAITYLINRSDYKDLAYAAQKLYTDSDVIALWNVPKNKISFFGFTNLKNFFCSFWIILSRSIGSGITTKLYYISFLLKILNQISLIEKNSTNVSIRRYICFNSAYKEEAILTSFFNKRNIETITMQHGIFCDFKISIPFDIINHENLLSQKLLCWGQSTVDYMSKKGMSADRFILEGNLKYRDIQIDNINQKFKTCLVLLGRGNYIETNNKLLELLSSYNKLNEGKITFFIKKHPFLHDEEHKQYASVKNNIIFLGKEHAVQEVLSSDLVDFSISVNTTAYYESLALGKPCLRWTESENEEFYGMDDKFENQEEFNQRMNSLKSKNQTEITKEIKQIIQYIFNPNLTI